VSALSGQPFVTLCGNQFVLCGCVKGASA
jgi:hypothetical protein